MRMRLTITALLIGAILIFGSAAVSYAAGGAQNTTVHLKHQSMTIEKGKSKTNVLVGAEGKVTWKSSNKKIAKVNSSGIIKGKKYGKCTITATYNGKTYKCRVKVIHVKPDFDAKIVAVKLKNGKTHIKVRFRNFSGKTLIIKKYAAYDDYTKPTYDIKLKKDVKIKGHKKKTLDFVNYGKYEIWNHAGRQDPDIFAEALESMVTYDFRFDKKTYEGYTYWDYTEHEDGSWVDYYESCYRGGTPTRASKR